MNARVYFTILCPIAKNSFVDSMIINVSDV